MGVDGLASLALEQYWYIISLNVRVEINRYKLPPKCKKYLFSMKFIVFNLGVPKSVCTGLIVP